MKGWIARVLAGTLAVAMGTAAAHAMDLQAGSLIAVLRESQGVNLPDETFEPYGTLLAQLPDGSRVELETSWFRYVGDMHIRLVFDGPAQLHSASPGDLDRLQLEPEAALRTAVANLKRAYGDPIVRPLQAGLMQVTSRADDLNSSYFLDREFWQRLERTHPGGIVAAVPQRGGLLFAPASNPDAVAALRFSSAALYAAGTRSRVSSAMYLFKDGHWRVFQPPMALQ
jgi:hypothetical protein